MTAAELWETTLDPQQRRALRVAVPCEMEADQTFVDLMGKDSSARYHFIMEHAPQVDAESLDV